MAIIKTRILKGMSKKYMKGNIPVMATIMARLLEGMSQKNPVLNHSSEGESKTGIVWLTTINFEPYKLIPVI